MTAKRDRVARGVRACIERGDYTDGQHLIQARLAAEFGVNREVLWFALADLEKDGWVTMLGDRRFVANATHASRQIQRVLNFAERLDLMETKLDALCRRLLPSSGPYAAPGVPQPWEMEQAKQRPRADGLTFH